METAHQQPLLQEALLPEARQEGLRLALQRHLAAHRNDILSRWLDRVSHSAQLTVRHDVSADAGRQILVGFFDMASGLACRPSGYAELESYVSSGDIRAFTLDAASRLLLTLKYEFLASLTAEASESPEPPEQTFAAAGFDEILLRMTSLYHETEFAQIREQEQERASVLRATQERLKSLLETMNEGFTAVDTDGNIIMFNKRMEEITGYSRGEVIGKPVAFLYTEDSLEELDVQLERRRRGESSSYELNYRHKGGRHVPVRVSGAPFTDGGDQYTGSFAVVTDITDQVRAEEDLRTRNAEVSRLLESEQRRSGHLATINEVARLTLSTLDPDEIFGRVVNAVQEEFGFFHTSLFLVEEGEMVMRARAGAYEPFFPVGYVQGIGHGIVGTTVATGEAVVANDVSADDRRILAFSEESQTQAELCVPIKTGGNVMGALDVQSCEANSFGDDDLASLQILADQLAWVIHNAQLYQETRLLNEFNEQVLQTIPLPVVLLDRNLTVIFMNQSYRAQHNLSSEGLEATPIDEVVPHSWLGKPNGREAISQVFQTGETVVRERERIELGAYRNRIVNISISRTIGPDNAPLALVVIEDITDSLEKAYQSSLLRQVGQTMQGILDPDRLLYTILTCVTAGTALGFNRAILLLVDPARKTLQGQMGVGPANHEEADRIWTELSARNPSVEDILAEYDRMSSPADNPLSRATRQVVVPLDDQDDILARTVREKKPIRVTEGDAISISPALWSALGSHHFVAEPLVAKGRVLGVIVADNLYSGTPIADDAVDLLSAFASHAALALDNSEVYHQLEERAGELEHAYSELATTQKELVLSERLAVIGEMSARMAHEIRNPMATIGGFARSILKRPDEERTKRAAGIIVEEVERLEKLLADTLSFTKPSRPDLAPVSPGKLHADICALVREDFRARGVDYHEDIEPDLPDLYVDASQVKQVVINIIQNALQAMPSGGDLWVTVKRLYPDPGSPEAQNTGPDTVWVEMEVRDSGEGISPEHLEQIYSPFYSTKTYGTGLGLAITRKIIEDHSGHIHITSSPDEGTTVRIRLPSQHVPVEG
jgi:PAS domain S-box-containing protein